MPVWSLGAFKGMDSKEKEPGLPGALKPSWSYRFERVRALEMMDDPSLDPKIRDKALEGIEAISHWWGQRKPLLRAILNLLGPPVGRSFRLIEVGAGSGHLSRWLEAELKGRGYDAEVRATDLLARPGVEVLDCIKSEIPEADLYFSSLVLHHLGDWEACQMLAAQARVARIGFVHFDLQRNFFHYAIAFFRTRFSELPLINQIDALLSIQQSYSRSELRALPHAIGLNARIQWSLPFRWLLLWKR
jgi:hypothetical protein